MLPLSGGLGLKMCTVCNVWRMLIIMSNPLFTSQLVVWCYKFASNAALAWICLSEIHEQERNDRVNLDHPDQVPLHSTRHLSHHLLDHCQYDPSWWHSYHQSDTEWSVQDYNQILLAAHAHTHNHHCSIMSIIIHGDLFHFKLCVLVSAMCNNGKQHWHHINIEIIMQDGTSESHSIHKSNLTEWHGSTHTVWCIASQYISHSGIRLDTTIAL